jgi:uncharacterized protein YbaR (Trm112 family)
MELWIGDNERNNGGITMSEIFCCPLCKEALASTSSSYRCRSCDRDFQKRNSIPDFFVFQSEHASMMI